MIPSPYSEQTLKQHFRVGDAGKWKLDIEKNIDSIAKAASARATLAAPNLLIHSRTDKSGKTIYFAGDIETDLILRATYSRLMHQFSLSLPNREEIVSGIVEATSEGSPYLVTKCDIRAFYESLNAEPIVNSILANTRTSSDLKQVLKSVYGAAHVPKSVAPRGLAISTVLAELTLKDFDNYVRKIPGVHRYFRYADDMIIFSLPGTSVIMLLEEKLKALGLELNDKTETREIRTNPNQTSRATPDVTAYTYLGYEFSPEEKVATYKTREFRVSIASAKLEKRTSRVFLALYAFLRDGDGVLLCDRLNYISTNRSVYKTKHTRGSKKQKIKTGIHYNYSRCGHYPSMKKGRVHMAHEASELIKIDVIMKTALFSKQSEFYSAISALPTAVQTQLNAISFAQGYRKRLMKRFTRERVGKICKAWGYE
ncbi:antiviral reverse transcriptase Drt3a [Neorhizobium galegae]|nr:antiviral reverse transcriptase Drt3a [Neorhizobium galegae]